MLAVESGAAYTPCIICEPYYVYGGRLICYDASVFHDYLLAPQDLSHSYSETFLRVQPATRCAPPPLFPWSWVRA